MKLSELIDSLNQKHPQMTYSEVSTSVKAILNALSHALSEGRRVEIRDFGVLQNTLRRPRNGFNPKTGEPVKIPAKYAPHFKAGKELRERVDYK